MATHQLSVTSKPQVLAVDDEPMNLELLERSLRRTYEVIAADSVEQAMSTLQEYPQIAVIISDYRMPGMNGAEFLAQTIKTHPTAKRVIITGYADVDNIIAAINSGQIHHLIRKPFNRQALIEVVDQLTHTYRVEQENRMLVSQLRQANEDLREKEHMLAESLDDRGRQLVSANEELEIANRNLEVLSFRDALTGLYNHRTFQERLREELARANRYGQPLSLIYGDIDNFAHLNAKLGYQVGDEILRRVADVIMADNPGRGSDIAARFGGEEFAILLPETDLEGAKTKAHRLRTAIADAELPNRATITMSFGVASFPNDSADAEELVKHAELSAALAKIEGKNQVHVYYKGDQERTHPRSELSSRPRDGFPSYHSRTYEIGVSLERDRTIACLYVDLSELRKIEQEFGLTQHAALFADVGAMLSSLRGDKLRHDDLVCRTEESDAYLCFLSPPRSSEPTLAVDLEAIAARIEEIVGRGLTTKMKDLTRDLPRVAVGYARVLNNPMMRPERLISRLVTEARQSAALRRQHAAQNEKSLLQEIILQDHLQSVYQPIVQISSGDIFGFEALTRGPADSPLEMPTALFAIADEVDLTFELDRACFRGALRRAIGLEPVHRLFVNLLPLSFYDASFIEKEVSKLLDAAALTPANVVFEITEKLAIENFTSFRQALSQYTAMGFGVAIDDVGTRHSNLETVMSLRPHFIKISDVLTRGVAQSTVKREMLGSMQRIAQTIDAVVVAEGIEGPDDLAVLCDLGIQYAQGFFLARPGPPFPRLKPAVRRAVRALSATKRKPIPVPPAEFDEDGDVKITTDSSVRLAVRARARDEGGYDLDQLDEDGEETALDGSAAIDFDSDEDDSVGLKPDNGPAEKTKPRLLSGELQPWRPLSEDLAMGSGIGELDDHDETPLIRSLRGSRSQSSDLTEAPPTNGGGSNSSNTN